MASPQERRPEPLPQQGRQRPKVRRTRKPRLRRPTLRLPAKPKTGHKAAPPGSSEAPASAAGKNAKKTSTAKDHAAVDEATKTKNSADSSLDEAKTDLTAAQNAAQQAQSAAADAVQAQGARSVSNRYPHLRRSAGHSRLRSTLFNRTRPRSSRCASC